MCCHVFHLVLIFNEAAVRMTMKSGDTIVTSSHMANLNVIVRNVSEALSCRDWTAVERLSERVRSFVLDAAMSEDRESLDRMRDKLGALRAFAANRLDSSDPQQAMIVGMLRADAGLAVIAARMRPIAASTAQLGNQDLSGIDKVRALLLSRREATTGEIERATGLVQTSVSKLLTILKAQGEVTSRRAGKFVYSRLTPRGRIAAGERTPVSRTRQLKNSVQIKADVLHALLSNAPIRFSFPDDAARIMDANSTMRSPPSPGFFDEGGPGISALSEMDDIIAEAPRKVAA
jgi:DNA-binding transcriptional ArsR family regulator